MDLNELSRLVNDDASVAALRHQWHKRSQESLLAADKYHLEFMVTLERLGSEHGVVVQPCTEEKSRCIDAIERREKYISNGCIGEW